MFQTLIFPGQLYFTTGKKLRFSYYKCQDSGALVAVNKKAAAALF